MMPGRPTAHTTCVTGISWLQHETQKGQPKPSIRHFQHGRWGPGQWSEASALKSPAQAPAELLPADPSQEGHGSSEEDTEWKRGQEAAPGTTDGRSQTALGISTALDKETRAPHRTNIQRRGLTCWPTSRPGTSEEDFASTARGLFTW